MARGTMTEPRSRGFARLIRFAIVGSFNTLLDFVLLFLFAYGLQLNTYLSNILSTGICLVVSFFLNKRWTFRSAADPRRQFVLFLVVTLLGLWGIQTLLIWGATALLTTFLSGPLVLLLAKGVATLGSLTWNYVLYARLVFRDPQAS